MLTSSNQADILKQALQNATQRLLDSRVPAGHWEGELSSSALSTATAAFAIHLYVNSGSDSDDPARLMRLRVLSENGLKWLVSTQNADGGWGDTTLSFSNISTTALCWAALSIGDKSCLQAANAAEAWLARNAGSIEPAQLISAIKDRYGKDRTFSVPILTMCAIAGRLGEGRSAWKELPQLPFEVAVCPHQWFQWIRLPVVSYALPALIALGQLCHAKAPTWNLPLRGIRNLAKARTLRLLREIQPKGGGFLEATPLTSFVAMSLLAMGQTNHPVVRDSIDFLDRSARADGSWPIDTNLSTWLTTLSINALSNHPEFEQILPEPDRARIAEWLLGQQYKVEHPYTRAAPGAWAWTDLPGGVPDADDTAGALIALWSLDVRDERIQRAAVAAVTWLLDLQNSDGGIPTFCRGWANLPFDRSGADLTAHALHAWAIWKNAMPGDLASRIDRASVAAVDYLKRQQRDNGSWVPLWFGNQHTASGENEIYGTARVLTALPPISGSDRLNVETMAANAIQFLQRAQNQDGSWGGGASENGSIEETSLAVHALAGGLTNPRNSKDRSVSDAVSRGIQWLVKKTADGKDFPPAPIGFYFAKLWYFERDYPLIFATTALADGVR